MNALRRLQRLQKKKRQADAVALLQKLPKPPKDNGQCACGCCHRGLNDHGPCPEFVGEVAGRCAVCDHGLTCHRRKGEPPPADWNVPIKLDERLRFRYPRRVNEMISTEVMCPECGAVLNFLDTLKARRPSGEIVSGVCKRCFEMIEGVVADELSPGLTVHDMKSLREHVSNPTTKPTE